MKSKPDEILNSSAESRPIAARFVASEQAAVPSELALTLLQIGPSRLKAALGMVVSGHLRELEPDQFRRMIADLAGCACGGSLDVLAEFLRLPQPQGSAQPHLETTA